MLGNDKKNVKTNLPSALHQVAELIHKRSLVIVFSDMLHNVNEPERIDELFAALQHLKFNKHEVVIFDVVDKSKEVDFEFENRPYKFIDMETGLTLKAHTAKVKDAYLQQMADYRKSIALKCAQYKIDRIDADINASFEPILQAYLIKRRKIG